MGEFIVFMFKFGFLCGLVGLAFLIGYWLFANLAKLMVYLIVNVLMGITNICAYIFEKRN